MSINEGRVFGLRVLCHEGRARHQEVAITDSENNPFSESCSIGKRKDAPAPPAVVKVLFLNMDNVLAT